MHIKKNHLKKHLKQITLISIICIRPLYYGIVFGGGGVRKEIKNYLPGQ